MALGEHRRIRVAGEPDTIIKHIVVTYTVEVVDPDKLLNINQGFLEDPEGNPIGMFTRTEDDNLSLVVGTVLSTGLRAGLEQTGVQPLGGSVTVREPNPDGSYPAHTCSPLPAPPPSQS